MRRRIATMRSRPDARVDCVTSTEKQFCTGPSAGREQSCKLSDYRGLRRSKTFFIFLELCHKRAPSARFFVTKSNFTPITRAADELGFRSPCLSRVWTQEWNAATGWGPGCKPPERLRDSLEAGLEKNDG